MIHRAMISAVLSCGICSITAAAIIPSWRINPIPIPPPSPDLANAFSVSLMVELTGGSLFNVAGLDLNEVFSRPYIDFYNQTPFGSDTPPNSGLFPIFPDLAYDTYVGTTTNQAPSVPGGNPQPASVGQDGKFRVAWGATPNTGGLGPREIARITIIDGGPAIGLTSVPITAGLVTDSLNPNTHVPLPPIPTPAAFVPEPGMLALIAPLVLILRRSR